MGTWWWVVICGGGGSCVVRVLESVQEESSLDFWGLLQLLYASCRKPRSSNKGGVCGLGKRFKREEASVVFERSRGDQE